MNLDEHFNLIARVWTNGSGTVWKAHDRRLDRLVALKSLDAPSVEQRAAAQDEARMLAQLSHPNLVGVHGYVESADAAYIVEEWIDGATLSAVLTGHGPLTPAQALGVTRGALFGLAYVHQQGIVHGDISPTNVLIDTAGESKLIDFGLAGLAGATARPATAAYQSPEVTNGWPFSPASDVYSAAAVLAMLLRGYATTEPSLDGIDAELRPVLARALDPDPTRRYPDAAALLAALDVAATRRYGAVWWTQAGLGAAAATSAAGMTAVGAGAAAGGSATYAAAPAGVNVVSTVGSVAARGTRRKIWLAAGTAAVAGIAGIAAYAATNHGSDQRDAARLTTSTATNEPAISTPSTAARATPSPTPTTRATTRAPLKVTTHVGQYAVTSTVASVTGQTSDPIGTKYNQKWTIISVCRADATCAATLSSTKVGAAGFPLPAKGRWTRIYTGTDTCTGGGPLNYSIKMVLDPIPGLNGLPRGFTGYYEKSFVGSCRGFYKVQMSIVRTS